MYALYFYMDERGDAQVRNYIKELNIKSRAKIGRYINLLEEHGPDLPRPYADQVRDKIRELRVKTIDGNISIFSSLRRKLYYFMPLKRRARICLNGKFNRPIEICTAF